MSLPGKTGQTVTTHGWSADTAPPTRPRESVARMKAGRHLRVGHHPARDGRAGGVMKGRGRIAQLCDMIRANGLDVKDVFRVRHNVMRVVVDAGWCEFTLPPVSGPDAEYLERHFAPALAHLKHIISDCPQCEAGVPL